MTKTRLALLIATGLLLLGRVDAAPRAPIVAVPYYTPPHHAQGLRDGWLAPRAAEFAAASEALTPALQRLCTADAHGTAAALRSARTQWAGATHAWERLSAVAVGPLLERRSTRAIDFSPTRPEQIIRAIDSAPADAAAMERIGSSAKGLPALEWLLWTRPVAPSTPACRYAEQVALDITREAVALKQAWSTTGEFDDEAGAAAMSEALNQWIAGLEALRWRHLERPLRAEAGGSSARDPAVFPRVASHETAASWAAQWQALRSLAVLPAGATPPQPNAGLVPFETYLRGLGLNPLADALKRDVARADARLQGLRPGDRQRVQAAADALAALKQRVETEVAPAMKVSIGFSDADGD